VGVPLIPGGNDTLLLIDFSMGACPGRTRLRAACCHDGAGRYIALSTSALGQKRTDLRMVRTNAVGPFAYRRLFA
jgi:hypothetical protein